MSSRSPQKSLPAAGAPRISPAAGSQRILPAASSPRSALLNARISKGSVILFDLDDTLIVSASPDSPPAAFASHTGYATVVDARGAKLLVAVRPFTLAAIATLTEAGFVVGFWSAGSPSYVTAIVERLVAAVRHMQVIKRARKGGVVAGEDMAVNLFQPAAVIALDHSSGVWVRDLVLERLGTETASRSRYLAVAPALFLPTQGIVKDPARIAALHPRLQANGERLLLIDNLTHDPNYTLRVEDFVPGKQETTGSGMDRVLLDVSREIMVRVRG